MRRFSMDVFCVLVVNYSLQFSKIRPLRAYFWGALIIREDTRQKKEKMTLSNCPISTSGPLLLSQKKSDHETKDFPVFQVHQAINPGFCLPNSTKQAHFNLFLLSRSARNQYFAVILDETFFNGCFLCPGGELFPPIQ
jgi:hypothetical protein